MTKTNLKQKLSLIFFGLFLGITLLEIGLRIGGFILTSIQEKANLASLRKKNSFLIMCLGESTTAFGGENSYSRQLEVVLNEMDIGITFSVLNKGVAGVTTTDILLDLEENLEKYKPDMVITMMGINDGAGTTVYEYTRELKVKHFFRSFRVYKLIKALGEHISYALKASARKDDSQEVQPTDLTRAKTEDDLKQALRLNSHNEKSYIELGDFHRKQNNLEEAEEFYDQARSINPQIYWPYIRLTRSYSSQSQYREAERVCKKAIAADPNQEIAYHGLGNIYKQQGRLDEAERMLRKAIDINPRNSAIYTSFGIVLTKKRRWEEAEKMYLKAFQFNPRNRIAFSRLVSGYLIGKRFEEAEVKCERAIEADPENDRAWAALARCYEAQGKKKLAHDLFKKTEKLRSKFINPVTARNYQKLKEIVTGRRIQLICVQYPMRSLENLKRMLTDNEGVFFVNNEETFKKAVKREGYGEYFLDYFSGDFGHCTPRGNRLLAENIADVILKEHFAVSK